jgi:hypothetical protein
MTANPLVQPTRMKLRAADHERYAARVLGGIRHAMAVTGPQPDAQICLAINSECF